ncbi:MAG: 50S ribosomal protein L27 [Candidatus Levybacteria bacterium RIFCSPHIGHO2_02_FULL_40_18]|nr:MAG: 50S ribosomal protein L27 [Candidatus Levybacteria bacterium RIFCSPHIGHO2_01_FULL_40_58]OGH27123.1 MAG: 50S ribosomal protein L27 [Candidatus Levybacteria bacterium RIFCSPHIGHO2_02_FULL_40_18]OGH30982.1 MAG: 50S ribosomal protein L27 [Candidatus Levybacteria bacterium RIFCSPHIGHO2_12_FULL_40_31]OGH40993.1 MAG: 50S ribosomal protein L27 [Candidatus Levybacteria bacterium RIFCSPLOWO2_01_FULL_40_64]OGH48930.1 MAG: 50S ribosomal protein L27 [Candidatus Levybacteria bacterium RIFCSPLOWO2_02_
MAHTKSQGAVRGNRDSISKRLGVKIFGGQKVNSGNIILRQRGTNVVSGSGTSIGRDFTIFATSSGIVSFRTLRGKKIVEVQGL